MTNKIQALPKSQIAIVSGLYNTISDLVYGEPVAVYEEGEILQDAHTKIRCCTKKLAKFFKESLLSLQQMRRTSGRIFVAHLFEQAVSPDNSRTIQARALFALECLAEANPHIASLCKEARALQKKNDAQVWAALRKYNSGIEKRFTVQVPLAPYSLAKTLPSYLCSAQRVPKQIAPKNPVMHRAFWGLKEIFINTTRDVAAPMKNNLRRACAFEKIPVSGLPFPLTDDWICDYGAVKTNGEILLPADLCMDEDFDKVLEQMVADPTCPAQGVVARSRTTEKLLQSSLPRMKVAPFYFEGGNLIQTFDPEKGGVCYLSGGYNLLYSFLNGEVTFKGREEDLLKFINEQNVVFSEIEIQKMQKMRKRLGNAGLFQDFPAEKDQLWLSTMACFAIDYIKKMMEETLEAPVIVLGDPLEPQIEFHLDMFLAPTPGFIGIQSYHACMGLIEDIYSNRDLSDDEKARLKMYYQIAKEMHEGSQQQFKEIADQLTQRGFKVAPLPGMFWAERENGERFMPVNFINSITGIGDDNLPFCITNGSGHPVDRYLREAFVARMKDQGVERVYFVGREEEQGVNLAITHVTAMKYSSAQYSLEQEGGGIHCKVQAIHGLTNLKPDDTSIGASSLAPAPSLVAAKDSVSVSLPRFFRKMLGMRTNQ